MANDIQGQFTGADFQAHPYDEPYHPTQKAVGCNAENGPLAIGQEGPLAFIERAVYGMSIMVGFAKGEEVFVVQ